LKKVELKLGTAPTEKMWSNVLSKPKQGTPFRKGRAIWMDIPQDYDDNVEYHRTHLELLLPEDKENLDHNGSSTRLQQSSRSLSGEVNKLNILPGVLKHNPQNSRKT
jgi:hypothetical protein